MATSGDRLIKLRSLDREVRVRCPDDYVAAELAWLDVRPDKPAKGTVDIEIVPLGDGIYDLAPPHDGMPGTASHIATQLRSGLTAMVENEAAGGVILIGCSLTVGDRRILVTGSPELSLLAAAAPDFGFGVEAPRVLALRGDCVDGIAARVVITEALDVPSPLRARMSAAPVHRTFDGVRHRAVVPAADLAAWRIRPGPATHLAVLEETGSALGGASILTASHAFARLCAAAKLPGTGRGAALARLNLLARTLPAWRIALGPIDRALWHLGQIART